VKSSVVEGPSGPQRHKMNLIRVMLVLVSYALQSGCGSSSSQEEAKLKQGYEKKNYSLEDVPVDKRAMVKAMMESTKKSPVTLK
jgi:uncharacterized protein YceK